MKYETILFDVDGTLCDPGDSMIESAQYALHMLGINEVAVTIDSLRHTSVDGTTFAVDASLSSGGGVNLKIPRYNPETGCGSNAELCE